MWRMVSYNFSLIFLKLLFCQMENFEDIWNECAGKAIDFANFEAVYPKVPQQDNGYNLTTIFSANATDFFFAKL